jgi:hypothetical protein
VPKTSAPPIVDGKLDDAIWKDAARATDFFISEYQRAPQEQTEVWALADDKAIYFAFLCHDSQPEFIHAEQLKRDGNVGLDDHVTVELDPYHNHRQISDFSVNARGTQSDAIASGRARKIEWKGDWQAAAQRTADGWTAEIAIPFAILNYQPGADTFGVNFVRYHHRTQERSRWADITAQFLPEESGHLSGLALPNKSQTRKLTIMQYGVAGRNMLSKTGNVRNTLATTGFDIRYDIANNLSSVLSLNPDFSQVEDVVLGLSFDYNEKFRRDNRPFFQEGSGFFGKRTYFFSGRVPDFDFGLKSFGKVGALQMGFLGVQAPHGRRDYVARVLREFGPTINTALTVVGSERSDFDNHLIALEANGRLKRRFVFGADLATTSTRGRASDGTRADFSLGYETPYWQAGIGFNRTDEGFFPANGFILQDSLGTREGSAFISYYREYASGPFRRLNGSVSFSKRDTLKGLLQRRDTSVYVSGETRSNMEVSLGMSRGPYRPRDEDTGAFSSNLNDDRFYTASIFFDTRSDRRGYGVTYSWGFLGGGDYSNLAPSFWFKPTRNTYLSYSYERADSFGVTAQSILSLSWEISPEQALSARWVRADEQAGGRSTRIAYRRQVRRGIDIFAVFNTDVFSPDRFSVKLVRTFGVR